MIGGLTSAFRKYYRVLSKKNVFQMFFQNRNAKSYLEGYQHFSIVSLLDFGNFCLKLFQKAVSLTFKHHFD